MLTDPNFLEWLLSRNITVSDPTAKEPFNPASYNSILNGLLISPIVMELLNKSGKLRASAEIKAELKNLATDQKFTTKTRNWDVIQRALKLLGYELREDSKSLIIAGVTDEIVRVLWSIKELEERVSTRGSSRKAKEPKHRARQGPDGALFLDSLESGKQLNQTTCLLEFLLVSMSQSFGLKPKQAAVLMTRNGHYLAKILCKGLRKQFVPVLEWLDALSTHSEHLTALMIKEKNNESLDVICEALSPGLLSKSESVVLKVTELLTILGKLEPMRSQIWEWFQSERSCLNSAIVAYGRYPDLGGQLTQLIFSFSKNQLEGLLRDLLPECFQNPEDYIAYINEFYDYLMKLDNIHLELLKGTLIDYWVSRSLEVNEHHNTSLLSSAELLSFIWAEFPHRLDETAANGILTCLKKLLRDRRSAMKLRGVCMMFHLVEVFTNKRHFFAPIIYKSLAFFFIEIYSNTQLRRVMAANFTMLFNKFDAIPISVLAEPLVKHLKMTECKGIEVGDIDLFLAMSRHTHLDETSAILLLDILAMIFVNLPVYARAASYPIIVICRRFLHEEAVQDYVVRFCRLGLKHLSQDEIGKRYISTRAPQISSSLLSLTKTMNFTRSGSVDQFGQSMNTARNGSFVLELIRDLFNLKYRLLTEKLQQTLIDVNNEIRKSTGGDFTPILKLLNKFGDPVTLTVLHANLLNPLALLSDAAAAAQQAKSARMKFPNIESSAMLSPRYGSKSRLLKPLAKSTTEEKIRADITKARQKWVDQVESEKKKVEQEEQFKKRQLKQTHQQIELQKIKLGIVTEDDNKPLIFPENSLSFDNDADLCEVADEDQVALQQVLRRNRRVLQSLFKLYAYTKAQEYSEKLLTEGQYWQLLKEQGLTTEMLTLDEFRSLLKRFCLKGRRQTSNLEFKGFIDFLVQVACFVFSKGRFDLHDLAPAISLTRLFEVMRAAFEARGESTAVFDEADSEIIRSLNQKLQEDPETELPSNYLRFEEAKLEVSYIMPECGLSEAHLIALSVLEEVCSQSLGVHLLRPIVSAVPCYFAKKRPMRASSSKGALILPVEFSAVLKEAIVDSMDGYEFKDLIEVGYTLHRVTEQVQKEATKGVRRNKAVEERTIKERIEVTEVLKGNERVQQRRKELKTKIQALKRTKAQEAAIPPQ
jgi:hypothetical protein